MTENSGTKQQLKGDPPTKSEPPAKGGTAKSGIHPNFNPSLLTPSLPEELGKDIYESLPFSTICGISEIIGGLNPLSKTENIFLTENRTASCTFPGLLKHLKASRTQQRLGSRLLKSRMSNTPIGLVSMSQFLSRLIFISNEENEQYLDKMREIVNRFLALFKIREKDKSKPTTSSFLKNSTEKKKSEKKKSHKCKGDKVEACQAGVAVEDCEASVAVAVEASVAVAVEDDDTFSFIHGVDSIDALLAFILAVLAVEPTRSHEIFDPLQQLELERLEDCDNFVEILFNLRLPFRIGIAISCARYQESKMQGSEEQTFYASEDEICDMLLQVLRQYGTVIWNIPAQAPEPVPVQKLVPEPELEQEQAPEPASEQEQALADALSRALTLALDLDLHTDLAQALVRVLALAQARDPSLPHALDDAKSHTKDPNLKQALSLAQALAHANAPAQTPTKVKRTQKTISQLFDVMCNCVSLLSMRFNVLQTEELSKSVSMGLALMQKIFHSALGDCVKTGLDGPFFKNVLQVLGVNDKDPRIMQDIQSQIQYFTENWDEICRRAGLSFERKKILLFLQSLYGQDLKRCLIILKTFIGSGKTASLCLFILSTLMKGESAIYMTPSLNEILRFFSGIIRQIHDLIYSEEFKTLPNSDFKTEMKKLHEKLRTLDVYTKAFKFGEVHTPDRMCVFLLAPTIENFGFALDKSHECRVYLFDDVVCSHALAKQLSENGSQSAIFIAGADVQDCKKDEFPDQHICELNIHKRIDVEKILGDARLKQNAGFQKFLCEKFLTKHTSDLVSSFVKMGINLNGSATIIDEEINSIENFFLFLRLVACDYDDAFMKVKHHYRQSSLMNLHQSKDPDHNIVMMQSGEITECLLTFVSGVLLVYDDGTHVPNDFSCSKRNHSIVGGDVVLDVKDRTQANPSTVNREDTNSSESVPTTVCGRGVAISVPSSKKSDSKTAKKDMREKADDDAFKKPSVELPRRPATLSDIISGNDFVKDMKMKKPKQDTFLQYCRLVNSLQGLTSDVKTVLKFIFQNGGGFVHTSLPLHHNTFVANVFSKNELTYLSTNYALESMNLGHVSMIVLLCSISEKDLRQLLGRMNRPNSGTFFQLVEDGRLVVLSLDEFYIDSQNSDGVQRTLDDSQNVPSFIDFNKHCSSLGIQVISGPILQVLRNLFRTYSDMFPKTFQDQVEKILTMACIRCFCPKMHFADKAMLRKDTGMLIGSCFSLIEKNVVPTIKCLSEQESLSAMDKLYGTRDLDVHTYLKSFMHLMQLVCAEKPYHLQPLDDTDKIEGFLEHLRSVLDASRFASVVVSMTTPIMADKKQKPREWMGIVASILEAMTTHLSELISLLEAKLISHNQALEKSKVSIGAIVSTKKVDESAILFSDLSKSVLEGLLDGTISHPYAITLVQEFITLRKSTAPKNVINQARSFHKALSEFTPSMRKILHRLLQKQQILRQKKRCRDVLTLRWIWAMGGNGTTRIRMLSSLLKLGPTGDTVLLATRHSIVKNRVMYNTVLPTVYSRVCNFLSECGFLQGGQCEDPVDAGNDTKNVSATAFEALKKAIDGFDKAQADEDPKFCEEINQNQNDALVAEISVSIDALQGEVSKLIDEVSVVLRKLYHFTKNE